MFKLSIHTRDISVKVFDLLRKKKIRHLLYDIDGTVISLGDKTLFVYPEIIEFIKTAGNCGFENVIVSNSQDGDKVLFIADKLGIYKVIVRGKGRRPKPFRLRKRLKEYGIIPSEAIMIGNNPINDGLGALLAGANFYFVFKP